MPSREEKHNYLAVDDYGSGGIWFVVSAASADVIHSQLPTVKIFAPPGSRPDWMSDDIFEDVARRRTFDIDDLPGTEWMNRLRAGDN